MGLVDAIRRSHVRHFLGCLNINTLLSLFEFRCVPVRSHVEEMRPTHRHVKTIMLSCALYLFFYTEACMTQSRETRSI